MLSTPFSLENFGVTSMENYIEVPHCPAAWINQLSVGLESRCVIIGHLQNTWDELQYSRMQFRELCDKYHRQSSVILELRVKMNNLEKELSMLEDRL